MAHSEDYTRHIDQQSAEWLAAKARRLDVDDCCCAYCGKPWSMTKRGLACHHVRYTGDLLDVHTIVTVCDSCHGILGGHYTPRGRAYDPRTPAAQAKFAQYMKLSDDYIDGKTPYNPGWFLDYCHSHT